MVTLRTKNSPARPSRRTVLQLFVVGLLCYIIIAGFSGLAQSWRALSEANVQVLAIAFACVCLSYVAAGATYVLLTPRALGVGPTVLVQVAGGLANRLLPAGLGGLGLNGLYLHRRGFSVAVSTAIVATNNLVGFFGNSLLVMVAVTAFAVPAPHITLPHVSLWLVLGAIVLLMGLALYGLRYTKIHTRLQTSWSEAVGYMKTVLRRPLASSLALLSSCCLTSLHATALYIVVHAAHAVVSWPVALLAISVGALTGAAVPTPGGLGGAEAGIAGLLTAFGLPASIAVAAAVLYRGLTYWIPLLPGYVALRIVEKRYL